LKGLKEYSHGNKVRAREKSWNRIIDCMLFEHRGRSCRKCRQIAASQALVLYLPGPHDADRKVARRMGFLDHNLIAVDVDPDNVKNVRNHGGIAICAQLHEVLASWPKHTRIDAVHADTCSSLDFGALQLRVAASCSEGTDGLTVLYINMQRGRERYSQSCNNIQSLPHNVVDSMLKLVANVDFNERHRGHLLFVGHVAGVLESIPTEAERMTFFQIVANSPVFFDSYKNGTTRNGVYMDSMCGRLITSNGYNEDTSWQTSKRFVAAALAVRTMKTVGPSITACPDHSS